MPEKVLQDFPSNCPAQLAVEKVDRIVNKTYLQEIQNFPLVPCGTEAAKCGVEDRICLFPVRKFTFDQGEDNFWKLASVYTGAAAANANPLLIVRGYASGFTELYLGVCGEETRVNGAYPKAKLLREGLIGQFPGFRADGDGILKNDSTRRVVNSCFDPDYRAVASVSCVASSVETNPEGKTRGRGMEKLMEAMSGKEFTFIVIARHLSHDTVTAMRDEFEQLYSQLAPLGKTMLTTGRQAGFAITESLTNTVSRGINTSHSATLSAGTNVFHTDSTNRSNSWTEGLDFRFLDGILGSSFSQGESFGTGSADGAGQSLQNSNTKQTGSSKSLSEALSTGKTSSDSSSLSVQYTFENKTVVRILRSIDRQLERLRLGSGVGMFAVSAYCLAPSLAEAKIGACTYKALITGDNTDLESGSINAWAGRSYQGVLAYLRQFRHPEFKITGLSQGCAETVVTPATFVTASELAIHMSLPQKKVNGISVREAISFGRNVHSMDTGWNDRVKIPVGHIYHLGREEQSEVMLARDSLTMHTFVTGTTGSGKSNCLYWILSHLVGGESNVRFLVVEPAKGEYKSVFGNRDDVFVYGTNPYKTPLLRVDPFSFPEDIHVLEHLDRLMDIFTVCWPLYAAMPAVLKGAIVSAYEEAGWNMRTSRNRYGLRIYPTFTDVMRCVKANIQTSGYSADTKGDYVGSLCTRLQELTDGINGMIFAPDTIADGELFERNVIVDLSRVGSAETKALIMGMLVIKLQEYRQSQQQGIAHGLRHVTVLEEAHNLLRKSEGNQEGSNVTSHAVEMLTAIIAELRSLGEGFIIADQAPELMDKSVIRNTNTKIVLRLPETSDRETVGRSIGLNDSQIVELTKLPCGVAAVYQNDWLDCVLVKIPYFEVKEVPYRSPAVSPGELEDTALSEFVDAIMKRQIGAYLERYSDQIERLPLPAAVKCRLLDYGDGKGNQNELLLDIIWAFFNAREAFDKAGLLSHDDFQIWSGCVVKALEPKVSGYSLFEARRLVMQLLLRLTYENAAAQPLYLNYCSWMNDLYVKRRGKCYGIEKTG